MIVLEGIEAGGITPLSAMEIAEVSGGVRVIYVLREHYTDNGTWVRYYEAVVVSDDHPYPVIYA